ncbi:MULTISPECIES: type II secretion system protein [Campylobacter]|nr:prepilin-type N-terminal cleavage/methylation domain-containing protein [Campylobacter sp. TJR-1]MDV2489478.1 prepilin-type N-terminal cleavage/methylation domain-containing protein [Campylobacter sp. TJR-1]
MKRAFTMIELVVAIVISGILLSIGVKIFDVIYTNYIRQKKYSRARIYIKNSYRADRKTTIIPHKTDFISKYRK